MAYAINYKAQYELVGVVVDKYKSNTTKSGVIGFVVLDLNTGILKTLSNLMIYKSINNEASKIVVKKQEKCEINNVANIRGISININLGLTPESIAEEIVNNIPYGSDCIPFLNSNDFNKLLNKTVPDKLKNHVILIKRSVNLKTAQVFDMNILKTINATYNDLENATKFKGKIITNAFMSQGVLKLKKADDSYEEAISINDESSYTIKLVNNNEIVLDIKKSGIKTLNLDLTKYVNPKVVTQTLVIKDIADNIDTLNIKTENTNLLVCVGLKCKKEKCINRINLYGNIKRFSIYQANFIVKTLNMSNCNNNVLKVMSLGIAPSEIINTTPNKTLSIMLKADTDIERVYSEGDLLITSSNYIYMNYKVENRIVAEDILTLPTIVVDLTQRILVEAEYKKNTTQYKPNADLTDCTVNRLETSEKSRIKLCRIKAVVKNLSQYNRNIELYHSKLVLSTNSCDIDTNKKTVIAGIIRTNQITFLEIFGKILDTVEFKSLKIANKSTAYEKSETLIARVYGTSKNIAIQVDTDATLGLKDKNSLIKIMKHQPELELLVPYNAKLIEKYSLSEQDNNITILGTREQREANKVLVANNKKAAREAIIGSELEAIIRGTLDNIEAMKNYNKRAVKDIFQEKKQLEIKNDLAEGKLGVKSLLGIDTSNNSNTIQISQAAFNVSQAIAKTFELDTSILDGEILSAVKKASGLLVAPIYTEDNFKIFYLCTRSITSKMSINLLQCGDTSIVLGDKIGEAYNFNYLKPIYLDAYIIIAANDKIMGSFVVGRVEVSGYKINSIDYNKSEIIDYSRREQLLALNRDLTIEFVSNAEYEFSTGIEIYKSDPKIGRIFYKDGVIYQPHLFLQPEGFTLCIANDGYSKIFVEISLYSNNPVYIIEADGNNAIITTNSEKVKKKIRRMRETLLNHNTYQLGYIIENIKYKRRIKNNE